MIGQIAVRRVLSMGPAEELGGMLPCELMNGRVGFLYAALFINRYLGQETVPWCMTGPIVDAVLAAGRAHATEASPLLYPWKSRRYWGASHGLAGIIQVARSSHTDLSFYRNRKCTTEIETDCFSKKVLHQLAPIHY